MPGGDDDDLNERVAKMAGNTKGMNASCVADVSGQAGGVSADAEGGGEANNNAEQKQGDQGMQQAMGIMQMVMQILPLILAFF